MDEKNYKIIEKRVEEIDLTLLIVAIPEAEVEDLLASLAREKGIISRNFYEDYVISVCVANINKLLYAFNQHLNLGSGLKMADVRRKIYDLVIECNPYFAPKHIFINKNSVLKLDKTGKKKLSADDVRLADNKSWELDNYEDILAARDSIDIAPTCDPNCSCEHQEESSSKKKKLPVAQLKPISSLEYEYTKKWWNRLNKYIEIKKFKEEDVEHILRSSDFSSRSVFNSYMVSICVKDVRDLFEFLDSIGVPSKVSPPILMHELFDLCRQVNPFITFEEALSWADMPLEKAEDRKKKKTGSSMSDYAKENKQKRKFKDVKKTELISVGNRIKNKLIGQNDAVDSLVESIQRAGVGLRDPEKPIGSFLFAGSTGCGKTECSKILAKELTKEKNSLVIIDCSEYSADHEYAKLIGSPNGYVAHEQGGYLTNAIQKNPFSVVVFDEVEKASSKVHELLLQVLDEGRLTDGKGNQISFKDTLIIMTSNVGASEVDGIKKTAGFGDVSVITDEKKDLEISKAIKKRFKPEFINRIDSIVYFKKLTKEDYMDIISLELEKLNHYLKSNDSDFKNSLLYFDNAIKELIYKEGVNEEYGARPLKRCIEKRISTPLALKLLKEDIDKNSVISVSAVGDEVVFNIDSAIDVESVCSDHSMTMGQANK